MTTPLKPGDKIDCLIKNNTIVHPYQDKHDAIWTFEIIAAGDYGYYLFVPQYYVIKETIPVSSSRLRTYRINPRFLGEQTTHITANLIYKVKSQLDGMCCCVCEDFVLMASPNRQDGSMVCYGCRQNPYR